MPHYDEHDLTLYFGPSSPHASKYSIPTNFFHDSSCDPILDVLMVFIEDHSSFIPSLECRLQPSINSISTSLSSKSFCPSIILGNESFPFDYFDEVDVSILVSFINSLDIDVVAYLLVFK